MGTQLGTNDYRAFFPKVMQILGLLHPVCKRIHTFPPPHWAHAFLTFLLLQWEGCVCFLRGSRRHAPPQTKGSRFLVSPRSQIVGARGHSQLILGLISREAELAPKAIRTGIVGDWVPSSCPSGWHFHDLVLLEYPGSFPFPGGQWGVFASSWSPGHRPTSH